MLYTRAAFWKSVFLVIQHYRNFAFWIVFFIGTNFQRNNYSSFRFGFGYVFIVQSVLSISCFDKCLFGIKDVVNKKRTISIIRCVRAINKKFKIKRCVQKSCSQPLDIRNPEQ